MRLLYLVSHPIQYQAPLLRQIAGLPGIELFVLFETLDNATTYHDPGFAQAITWDVPLTDGYDHAMVRDRDHLRTEIAKSQVLWIHGWDTRLKRKALKMARQAGVRTLMRGENTDAAMPDGRGLKGLLKRLYLARIFSQCDGFLCIGADNRDYYRTRGIGDARLFAMAYTVDNAFFATRIADAAKSRTAFRQSLNIPGDCPVILFAGKLQARKHPLTLLRAFKALDRQKAQQPVLIYVGDGEQRRELEAAAAGMADRVKILGFKNQTELPAFYDLADVFVLAAEKEPWGLSVNEAMIGGCVPVVTPECGCARDLVDARTGRIVAPGDADALAAALAELLADRARLAAMAAAAKDRIAGWGLDRSVAGLTAAIEGLGVGMAKSTQL
ncbi:MAG: glycosyltransferase family 4 protein [Rhodospirillales bacterium]|nr:glycosyltransferase family 4 protein [Rhodospirillales bacterium]